MWHSVYSYSVCALALGLSCAFAPQTFGTDVTPAKGKEKLVEAGKAREFPKVDWAKRTSKETAHYHLETNVPEDAQQYLMALLEAEYSFYAQRLGVAPAGKLNVFVYATMEDFAADALASLKYSVRPGESGMYVPHPDAKKRGLYVPWVKMRSGLEPTAIVLHEGFHQFYHALYKTQDPKWFNEAIATYYENMDFDGEKVIDAAKISSSKLKGMQDLIKKGGGESLAQMMQVPAANFVGPQYCEAWSFVYFMFWSEKDSAKRADMQRRFLAFFAAVKDSKQHTPEGFEHATGLKLADLEPKWKEFVQALNPDDAWGGLGDPAARK